MAYTFLGTYTGTCYNVLGNVLNTYYFKTDVYIEQNIEANTSKLKIIPYIGMSGGTTVTSATYQFTAMDSANYYSTYFKLGVTSGAGNIGTELRAPEIIKTIYHNDNGTKSITLNTNVINDHTQGANANLNNYCVKRGSISVNITLPTIPRASQFSVSGNKIGSPVSLSIAPYVSSFRHHVYYKFGSINTQITSSGMVSTSCSFTPTLNDAKQIPNSVKGACTIVVDTYNGSTLVGSRSHTFDLYVADSMYPSFTSLSLDGNGLMENKLYIAGRSTVSAKINGATGSYGSTISKYSITGHNLSTSSSSGVSSALAQGTHTYTATITDSRGRTATKTGTISVYAYSAPTIANVYFRRTDANGNDSDDGSSARISFNATVQDTGGAKVNAKTYSIAWRLANGNWNYDWKTGTLSSYSQSIDTSATSGWDIAKSYEIKIDIIDSLSTISAYATIGTTSCIMNIEDKGIGVGKYHEQGTLDIKGDVYVDGSIVPTGEVLAQGPITSRSGIYGTSFNQNSANYGTPLEFGRYIDFHNIGSSADVDVRLETGNTRDRLRVAGGGDLSRYVEIGINSNGGFIKDGPSGNFLQFRDDGRMTYDGSTVPHNWKQSFSPFVYADTGTFSSSSVVGQATYLGDLVFIQGRIIASRGGHSGAVCIGGLPVSNVYNYPAVEFGFFGGVTTNLGSAGYDIRGYIQANASHIVINFSNKDNGGWTGLQCSHLTTGSVDINFSAVYRWR